jgi:hypothetical protein
MGATHFLRNENKKSEAGPSGWSAQPCAGPYEPGYKIKPAPLKGGFLRLFQPKCKFSVDPIRGRPLSGSQ